MSSFHFISKLDSDFGMVLACLLVTLFIGGGLYQVRVGKSDASSPDNPNFVSSRLVSPTNSQSHIHTTRKR